eukprot:6082056-Pyramimonas_sp.AAC.1
MSKAKILRRRTHPPTSGGGGDREQARRTDFPATAAPPRAFHGHSAGGPRISRGLRRIPPPCL